MATTGEKIAIGGVIGLAAWALLGGKKTTGNVPGSTEPPVCGPGSVPQLQTDGTWKCVEIATGEVVLPDDDDEPLPPKPNTCNYSGCGSPWDDTHQHPSIYAQRLIDLGYPMPIVQIAQNGTLIAVSPARNTIREFQRDFNAVRASNGFAGPAAAAGQSATLALGTLKSGPKLGEDGLYGVNTITANVRAQSLVNQSGVSWANIVALSGGG